MPGPAALCFRRHEGRDVAADERLHDRMLGREALQQHPSRRLRAPCPSGDLMQQLQRPLARAEVAAGKAEVGIDHAHQRQMRKMPALGHDLRADDEIDGADR